MKSIEKMTKRPVNHAKKSRKKDPINRTLNLLIATVMLGILVIGTAIGIKEYREERKMDLSYAFSRDSLLQKDPMDLSCVNLADSFA
ncbi:MAG: hypothetical protein SOT28_08300, partial [Fusicatenibacter sp.]|nr:hypothetical protein [Fusicatenibacter sp.]